MYALSGTSFVRRNPGGDVIEESGFSGGADHNASVMWSGPTELHTIENTGDADLVVIAVEVLCGS